MNRFSDALKKIFFSPSSSLLGVNKNAIMQTLLNQSVDLDRQLVGCKTEKEKKLLINRYLDKIELQAPVSGFDSSLEWFNVSRPLSVNDLNGRVVVIDFFTYCCINCIHAISELKALENAYPLDKVLVIGVHSAKFDNEKVSRNVRDAVARYRIAHPVLNDRFHQVWKDFSVRCWPTVVVLDQKRRVVKYFIGESHLHELTRFAEVLMSRDSASERRPLPLTSSLTSVGPLFYPGKVDYYRDLLCISDTGNNRLLIVSASDGKVLNVVGEGTEGYRDGELSESRFSAPQGAAFYSKDLVYVADTGNHAVRLVNLAENLVTTVVKPKARSKNAAGKCSSPWDVMTGPDAKDGVDNVLYIAMAGNHQIYAYSIKRSTFWDGVSYEEGDFLHLAGSGREENRNNCYPHKAAFAQPSGLTFDPDLRCIYIADSESSAVRRLNLKDGSVEGLVGGAKDPTNLFSFGDTDGAGTNAQLQHLLGVQAYKGRLYIADTYNHKIKVVDNIASGNICRSLIKSDLKEPSGLTVDAERGVLYVADTNNHRIVKYTVDTEEWSNLSLNFNATTPATSEYDKESRDKLKLNGSAAKLRFKGGEGSTLRDFATAGLECRSDHDSDNNVLMISFESKAGDKKKLEVTLDVITCDNEVCGMKTYNYVYDIEFGNDSKDIKEFSYTF